MASKHNFAYKLTLIFTLIHFGSSQYYVPLIPQPRFGFGLISNLFSFGGGTCNAQGGGGTGTCVDFTQCSSSGGQARGICGFGFKTCCLPAATTRATIPTAPTPTGNAFLIKDTPMKMRDEATIRRISSSYCQVRIDFESFDIDPTNTITGVCPMGGRWTASGQREVFGKVPVLCGKNSGQHMYLNFDSAGTPIKMNLVTGRSDSYWLVTTKQILCTDQDKLAPDDCLQFFTESFRIVEIFNYQAKERTNTDTFQLANLDYKICIQKTTTTFSQIIWSQDTSSLLSFTMSRAVSSVSSSDANELYKLSNVGDIDCPTDFVEIKDGIYTDVNNMPMQTANKFCSLGFPTKVMSTSKPFYLRVFTDGDEIQNPADQGNVGFSLKYVLLN